jgi:hypothetical protein
MYPRGIVKPWDGRVRKRRAAGKDFMVELLL